MSQYQPGETIRATVDAQVISAIDEGPRGRALHVQLTMKDGTVKQGRIHIDAPGVNIERVLPADGDAQEGDLWRDRDGGLWFAQLVETDVDSDGPYIELRPESTSKRAWGSDNSLQGVNRAHGPLALAYREQAAEPEPSLTAADLVGMDGGPIVIAEAWNGGLPVRILRADHATEDEVYVGMQAVDDGAYANRTVPRTTPIRLVGGA